jgi:hypothetical protein
MGRPSVTGRGLRNLTILDPSCIKVIIQHRSLVGRIHSFGVHLSHIQKAYCLQNLQQQAQQQQQQQHVIKVQQLLPQFPSGCKYSEMFILFYLFCIT